MNRENDSCQPSVLIVDDNPKNLQILGVFLQYEGLMVEFALDGKSALNWLEKRNFDLILLDVMMPGMNGFEVCSLIKKNPFTREIPIIFITAAADSESIIKGFKTGAVDYVTKPFIKSELLIRVKTQIEIKRGRDAIALNLKEIELKNKLITSSIQYAEAIQTAIMKSSQTGLLLFPEHFCLFLPKDIVSGDFYWFHKIENKLLIGVFDCTGHGIPGAFMSILGVTLLNETVIREKIIDPHLILNRLREKIIEALGQKGISPEVGDGMDGLIISYDPHRKKLVYSGAYNSTYLLRNNEIIELKGDKMPLSYHLTMTSFSSHEMKTESNDILYLFTDGYIDQFGGQPERKFRRSQLKELFVRNHNEPFQVQKQLLMDAYINWRGHEDQVDDITIIGLKL
ncbi:MAG: response regulator [Bacteroidales bacterium]|nr:response regulator [Bacteroidales bacterium]